MLLALQVVLVVPPPKYSGPCGTSTLRCGLRETHAALAAKHIALHVWVPPARESVAASVLAKARARWCSTFCRCATSLQAGWLLASAGRPKLQRAAAAAVLLPPLLQRNLCSSCCRRRGRRGRRAGGGGPAASRAPPQQSLLLCCCSAAGPPRC
jgi:hypothetical protein